MEKIENLLGRLKNIDLPDISIRRATCEAIREIFGEEVSIKNISVKNKIIKISTSRSFRNEIYFNRDQLLKKIKEKTKNLDVTDIN